MTKVLVVPADVDQPMVVVDVEKRMYNFLNITVDGYIEVISSGDIYTMYANEESRIIDPPLPPNNRVNQILGREAVEYVSRVGVVITTKDGVEDLTHEVPDAPRGYALGNVVITGPLDDNGNDTDVPDLLVHAFEVHHGEKVRYSTWSARK